MHTHTDPAHNGQSVTYHSGGGSCIPLQTDCSESLTWFSVWQQMVQPPPYSCSLFPLLCLWRHILPHLSRVFVLLSSSVPVCPRLSCCFPLCPPCCLSPPLCVCLSRLLAEECLFYLGQSVFCFSSPKSIRSG